MFTALRNVTNLAKQCTYGTQSQLIICCRSLASQTNPDQHILTENRHGVLVITLNRPEKYNAFTAQMYANLGKALRSAATDDTVTMAMITGTGKYFTTGNDLGNWEQSLPGFKGDIDAAIKKNLAIINELIASFIDFRKPLIGAVNGPAIGIGTTTLALMDAVVASDAAYFHTPFTALGISAEACSSYTFPKIMGSSMAADMLIFNRKLTAPEALQCGLVARVIPGAKFSSWVEKWVFDGTTGLINTCYPKSMQFTKHLLRDDKEISKLYAVRDAETERLRERMAGAEVKDAIDKFNNRKKSANK